MKIKNGCNISISGRNKRGILLVGVILSIVTLLTPVSLAATVGISVNKITDQSANTNGMTAPLLNTASSALILSILNKVETTSQSVNNYEEPAADSSNAMEVESISSNVVTNSGGVVTNSGGIEPNLGVSDSILPWDPQVGDILIYDAGYPCGSGLLKLLPNTLNGHTLEYVGPHYICNGIVMEGKRDGYKGDYVGGDCVEAVPRYGVRFFTLRDDKRNYEGETFFAVGRVNGTNETQRENAAHWAIDRVGSPYQEYWSPAGGLGCKWYNPDVNDTNRMDANNNKWYCSELVWASYYNVCYVEETSGIGYDAAKVDKNSNCTIDIDQTEWEEWEHLKRFTAAGVTPKQIYWDDQIDLVYDPDGPRSKHDSNAAISLSDDSDSNSNSNAVSYSESEDTASNYLNSGSKSNTVSYTSSSLNANTLLSYLLKIPKSH